MLQKERSRANYIPISGIPREGMLYADMHAHVKGDTAGTPEQILKAARGRGVDTLTITDHDSTSSYEKASRINETRQLGLTLIRSVESTAVIERKIGKRGKPRHILVYDVSTTPPCYMPVKELNVWAHEQGGYTSAAHPGLGSYSMTQREIMDIQDSSDEREHLDFAEVRNGGILTLNNFARNHPYVTNMLIRAGLMPIAFKLNEMTEKFLENKKEKLGLKGVTAGSDGHDPGHIGEVVLGYDPDENLFDAIKKGKTAILQQDLLAPEAPKEFIIKTLRSWGLEINRRRGKGILLYEGKSSISHIPLQEPAVA